MKPFFFLVLRVSHGRFALRHTMQLGLGSLNASTRTVDHRLRPYRQTCFHHIPFNNIDLVTSSLSAICHVSFVFVLLPTPFMSSCTNRLAFPLIAFFVYYLRILLCVHKWIIAFRKLFAFYRQIHYSRKVHIPFFSAFSKLVILVCWYYCTGICFLTRFLIILMVNGDNSYINYNYKSVDENYLYFYVVFWDCWYFCSLFTFIYLNID